jgi:CPA1 family monovalent cation:H+ antiporter
LSSGEATLNLIRLFVLLLGASAIVTILAKRIKLPYTVGLVAFGLAAGAFAQPLQFEITPQLVLVVLLPALIFEASYRTDLVRLRSSLAGVALLAGPGVFVSAAIIAAALNLGAGLPWPEAFVVGAMLSATDPAAVIATFRRLRSPARLSTLVEGESVFNDGTGIVVFSLAVDFVSRPVGPLEVTADFVSVVVLSTALGAATGYLASRVLPHVGDHLIEISLSVVLAYGTYLVADAFHQSGVIATAVSGITLGNYGRRHGLSEVTEEALTTVWDFVAYLATAFVFLVVGFAIAAHSLVNVGDAIVWATIAALVSRAVIVYLILGAWRWTRQRAVALVAARRARAAGSPGPSAGAEGAKAREAQAGGEEAAAVSVEELPPAVAVDSPRVLFPIQWLHVVFWSGLRGAVSTALALSLPVDFPDRAELQGITFGVVLFTLVVQATTAEWVVSRWGIPVETVRAEADEPRASSAA